MGATLLKHAESIRAVSVATEYIEGVNEVEELRVVASKTCIIG